MQNPLRSVTLMMVVMLAVLIIGCGGGGGEDRDIISGSEGDDMRVIGSGNVISESRDVSGFTRISLSGIGQLQIEHGEAELLTIQAEDNIVPLVMSEVRGNELILTLKSDTNIQTKKEIIYKLTVETLDELQVQGAANINAKGLRTDRLKITLGGAGQITVSGKVNHQEITIAGAGDYQAENLESLEAKVVVMGAGSAVVNVSDKLCVQVGGTASVEYIGSPAVEQTVTGLGSVRKR